MIKLIKAQPVVLPKVSFSLRLKNRTPYVGGGGGPPVLESEAIPKKRADFKRREETFGAQEVRRTPTVTTTLHLLCVRLLSTGRTHRGLPENGF